MSAVAVRPYPVPETVAPQAYTRRRRQVPWTFMFVLALELAMFAPLLRSGTVWLLDAPATLMGPHPHAPDASWASAPWIVVRAPFEHLLETVYRVLPWGQVRLLPLLAFPVIATLGFRKLFGGDPTRTIAATLLFVVNPFVYERMVAGQEYLLLGVAVLPAITALVVRARSGVRSGLAAGAMLAAAVVLSPHLAFVGGVLVLALFAGSSFGRARAPAIAAGVTLVVCAIATLPLAFAGPSAGSAASTDLVAFRTAADPAFGVTPNVLGLYGFWRQGWPLAKDALPAWPVFVAAILVVGAVGAATMRRGADRVLLVGVAVAGLAGLLLALGDQGPTGPAFAWLYRVAPAFRVMREPQKFAALLALGYAVTFGAGVAVLVGRTASRRSRTALLLLLLAVPCAASIRSFWGFGGYVAPSPAPSSWTAADRLMGAGDGAVLALPWHRYLRFPFTQDRVVASPFLSAFARPVIVSDDPELEATASAPDERAARAGALLPLGAAGDRFGELLLPLEVRYIVLAKVQDWRVYEWLYEQEDLELVAEWDDLVLFRNVAEGGGAALAEPLRVGEQVRPIRPGPKVAANRSAAGWRARPRSVTLSPSAQRGGTVHPSPP